MIEEDNGIPKTDFSPITLPDGVDYKQLSKAHDNDDEENLLKDDTMLSEDELYTPDQAEKDNLKFFQDTAKNPTSRSLLERLKASLKPQRDEADFEEEFDPKQENLSFDQLTDSTFGHKAFLEKANIPDLKNIKQDIEKNADHNLEKMDLEDDQTERLIEVLDLAKDQSHVNKIVEKAKDLYADGYIRKENLDKIIEIANKQTSEIQKEAVGEFVKELQGAENVVALGIILARAREQLGNKKIDAKSIYLIEKSYKFEKKLLQDGILRSLTIEINAAETVKDLDAAHERAIRYQVLGSIEPATDLELKIFDIISEVKIKIQDANAKLILDKIKSSIFSESLLLVQDEIQLCAANDEISRLRHSKDLLEELKLRMMDLKDRERQDDRRRAIEDALEIKNSL